jgi:hypothetical protein
VSFVYPLFLLAGLAIAVPIIIHLFNLRRYKTVYFPHTRFLKNIQLNSQKQSQVRYKLLLTFRILFLALLVLAFAQPFLAHTRKTDSKNNLQIIYLDNSSSMSIKKGARNLLDIARDEARKQIQNAPVGTRFILLSNDKPVSYQPMPAEKAMAALNSIEISSVSRPAFQVLSTVQGLVQSEASTGADLYYYSDFQKNNFPQQIDASQLKDIDFYGVPVRASAVSNVYIDTAFLTSPVIQAGQDNKIVVKTRYIGKAPGNEPVLQLSINGQVKSASSVAFNDRNEGIDTLSFQVNSPGWQRLLLSINDAAVRFDDSFRITARSSTNLAVLVINEGQSNPYIQAAFRAYNGFRMDQKSVNEQADWGQYNLIILNNITRIDEALSKQLNSALQKGQSICLFPGKTTNINQLNEGLAKLTDIRITRFDTSTQSATSLQQGSDLVKDLFERIPENVQLPQANWHYSLSSGLTANQQSILSFRNGDPLLAQYNLNNGKLYILATSADLPSGNFPGSYFFVPFLYQMTVQSKGGDVYAITAGKPQPVYLPMNNANERNMVHAYADGVDVIPPQRPAGAGLNVYLGQAVQRPGFYSLSGNSGDSAVVAMNQDRVESELALWEIDELRNGWKGENIRWMNISDAGTAKTAGAASSFPLWKVCIILALLMLAAETYLLAARFQKQTLATK